MGRLIAYIWRGAHRCPGIGRPLPASSVSVSGGRRCRGATLWRFELAGLRINTEEVMQRTKRLTVLRPLALRDLLG
jgi:hypothetical protein